MSSAAEGVKRARPHAEARNGRPLPAAPRVQRLRGLSGRTASESRIGGERRLRRVGRRDDMAVRIQATALAPPRGRGWTKVAGL